MSTQITTSELKSLLEKGPVNFEFKKKDGTLREANGTLDLSHVPLGSHPKGGKGPRGIVFFDLDLSEWRCVSLESEVFIK